MIIHPSGTIEGSPEELATFFFEHVAGVVAARNGRGVTQVTKDPDIVSSAKVSRVRKTPKVKVQIEVFTPKGHHSVALTETLEWMRKNDTPHGISSSETASGLGISSSLADWRLKALTSLGHSVRISRGRYRYSECG